MMHDGPLQGCHLSFRANGHLLTLSQRWNSASTPLQALPCSSHIAYPLLLLHHMPRTPTSWVLQWWLLSALPADLMLEVPLAMASAAPTTGSTPSYLYAPTPEGLTSLASMSALTTMQASPRGSGDMQDRCICHH